VLLKTIWVIRIMALINVTRRSLQHLASLYDGAKALSCARVSMLLITLALYILAI
jgi:hypothetical protein